MEYNSQRPHLIISEYGRHIQRMIDHTCEIADREERNKMARYIISVMGQLNPHLRDVSDFKHKLWDHLFIMSDFRLDVDSPYPIPSRESFQTKPDRIPYPNAKIRFRHYGKIIEKVIEESKNIEEGPIREALIGAIAYNLKKSYLTWNRDSVQDEQIFKDLSELSGGLLKPAEGTTMTVVAEGVSQNYPQQQGKKFNRGRQKQKNFKRKFGGGTSF
ncbi:MAG TPA: DUF4290 domain-containing protein [Flavobacteriales bacterium]|jgi:hypothetical protein|nr:DUF4290 domain-containing protein [Flavobacteriales bacterium]HPH80927.1 DUF4290 domain-containing protein [Flavobacteriales bacterium]